ncbi:hypothetical protein EAI_17222, partial [Harpegnathos saltator]
ITSTVLDAAMKILGFSVRFRSLNGTSVKVLRDASAAIAAGTTLIVKRMEMSEGGENLEIMDELREENQQL